MIVYHVCSPKKYKKYVKNGGIKKPVRGWDNIQQAERMSISTGRTVILRLKFPDKCDRLDGHFNQAVIMHEDYIFNNSLLFKS